MINFAKTIIAPINIMYIVHLTLYVIHYNSILQNQWLILIEIALKRIQIFLGSHVTNGTIIVLESIFSKYVCDKNPRLQQVSVFVKTRASFPSLMEPDLKPLPY